MAKISISAESTCDLPQELIKLTNVHIIPLAINLNEKEYYDGVDINAAEIFDYVYKNAVLPKTAARSVDEYVEFFEKSLKGFDALIHIAFGSAWSVSYENAKSASDKFKNVFVIDGKNLSSGQGLIILKASEIVKDNNMPVNKMVDKINELTSKSHASFILNTLKYLQLGGRCSKLVMLGANLLNIKPTINVVEGKMVLGKKYMGKIKDTSLKYVQDTLKMYDNIDMEYAFLTYSSDELIDINLLEKIIKDYGFKNVYINKSGCTISSHCGPNCVGVLFLTK